MPLENHIITPRSADGKALLRSSPDGAPVLYRNRFLTATISARHEPAALREATLLGLETLAPTAIGLSSFPSATHPYILGIDL